MSDMFDFFVTTLTHIQERDKATILQNAANVCLEPILANFGNTSNVGFAGPKGNSTEIMRCDV
jgi:hypothetical protein